MTKKIGIRKGFFGNSYNSALRILSCYFLCGSVSPWFKNFLPIVLLLWLFLLTSTSKAFGAENKSLDAKGPIVITSSTLTADNKARTALFEGSVTAKTDSMTIYSDRMLVRYSEGGNITRIDASGHVRLIRGERVITSAEATYLADDEKVIFTGEPKAAEGGNVVTGTKMIYLMREDRSIVENSKVFIERGSPKGR